MDPNKPIVVEHTIQAPASSVWRAMTTRDEMVQWFFEPIPEFEPRVGFEVVFDVAAGERVFPHRWRITAVTEGERFAMDWLYDGYPGDTWVEFQLSPVGDDATRVRVTHHTRVPFPSDIPEFTVDACRGGWEWFIGERLPAWLAR